jgi:hypothetical protein
MQDTPKMARGMDYGAAYEQKFGFNPLSLKALEQGVTRPDAQQEEQFNSAWDKANPYVARALPEGLSHPGGPSTMALVNWYNEKTGQRYTANSGGYQAAPGSGWRIVKPTSYEGKIGGGIGEIVSQDPINMPGFVGPTYSAPSTPAAPPTLPSVGAKAPSGIPPVPTEVPATQTPSPGALPSTPSYAPTYGALPSTPSYAPTYGALPSTPTTPSVGSTTTGSGKNMALLDFLTSGAPLPAGTAPISKTTTTATPDWYTNYAKDLMAGQQNISTTPYQTYQGPRIANFTPTQQQGMQQTIGAAGLAAPAIQQGIGVAQGQIGQSGLSAAQPYLSAAGQNAYGNVANYMNPYNDAVTNRIAELGARNLREQLLPEISDRFVRAGQFGGSRQSEMIGRGMRDIYESTLAQQNAALQSGYGGALTAAQEDLRRQGQLATTAGNLGTEGVRSGLDVAKTLAELGTTAQTAGLAGAKAVTDVGAAQQGMNQQNLTLAYQDYLKQQGYPQEQIDAALKTMGAVGAAKAVPEAKTEVGIQPTSYEQQYAQSPLDTALSTGSTAIGIYKDLKDAGLI